MSDSIYKPKLSMEARHEICRLIAEYTPPTLIQSYILEQFGEKISLTNINHYKRSKRWLGLINTHRNYFIANIKQIPMSHKAVRLARLENLFVHAVRENNTIDAVRILRQAQHEMEGIKIVVGQEEFSPTASMSDDDIAKIIQEAKDNGISLVIPGDGKFISN